jgi:hypothetical protein
MRWVLHILTKPDDPLAAEIVERQGKNSDLQVRVVDLTVAEPNYEALLQAIFEADSLAVW